MTLLNLLILTYARAAAAMLAAFRPPSPCPLPQHMSDSRPWISWSSRFAAARACSRRPPSVTDPCGVRCPFATSLSIVAPFNSFRISISRPPASFFRGDWWWSLQRLSLLVLQRLSLLTAPPYAGGAD